MHLKSQYLTFFAAALLIAFSCTTARAQTAPAGPPSGTQAPTAAPATPAPQNPPVTPAAQSAPNSGAQSAPAGTLHGHIHDPTGALIPGAQVTVATAAGKNVGTATADSAGGYQVRGLPAGSYVIQASFPGFAPFVSAPIALTAGQTKNIDIKMAIEAAQQRLW